ncbi:MAG: hypothetical protein DRQ51_08545 [Gammaproteobacteria bacterium]|nr:MAG: hypothetical protein DRQ51_08545 [Gammaproteobacteria bacterium]
MLFSILSIIFYLVASYLFIIKINQPKLLIWGADISTQIVVFSILALFFHFFYLYPLMMMDSAINLSFINTLSLASFVVVFIMLLYSIKHQVMVLGIGILPVNAIIMIFLMFLPQAADKVIIMNLQSGFHIFSSIVAFGIFSLSLMQVILLSIQNYALHHHKAGIIIKKLPALFVMEHLLINMILAGQIFLSLSLLSGFLFMDDMFSQHIAHKTILSIISWVVFNILLLGHVIFGWRGKTLIILSTSGILTLIAAFLVSKFILQNMIN